MVSLHLRWCAALLLACTAVNGAYLGSGTELEVRFRGPSGSRISHAGDRVEATLIAPVWASGELVIPAGATIHGVVKRVDRVGFGFRHATASIEYQFTGLRLPGGREIPLKATVSEIETAKERVNAQGVVSGIYPTANLSSSVAPWLIPLLCVDPPFGMPALGVKVLIARSPDPEIYFPVGTEAILRTTASAVIPEAARSIVAALATVDLVEAERLLAALPQQRSHRSRNRPSDLVNILFLGKQEAITRAFEAAGWTGAHGRSPMSIFGMYHAMVQRMGYSMAPMDRLTLNGVAAGLEFQKSLDTFSKRHHARLWQQAGDVYLSAATEDIGYTVRRMHLTHATDPVIDNERNKILNDLAFTGCVEGASFLARQGGVPADDTIRTDGRVAVIRVNDCRAPKAMDSVEGGTQFYQPGKPAQAMLALRNDLLRFNPAFLTFNTTKALWTRRETPEKALAASGATSVAGQWNRPSVLDEKAGAYHRASSAF